MSLSPVVIKTQVCFIVPLANLTSPPFLPNLCHMLQPYMSLSIVFSWDLFLADKAEKQVITQPLQVLLLLARTLNIEHHQLEQEHSIYYKVGVL